MSGHKESVKVEARNNLTPDHSHTRPADVLVQNWSRGRPAALDIYVTSLLNTLTLSEAGVCAGAAAQAGEVRKHSPNDDKCGVIWSYFIIFYLYYYIIICAAYVFIF